MTNVDEPRMSEVASIPLVAIGASAGGLEPLEAFFQAAPSKAGWSFIVIQHLSPDYRSMMDELLGRRSRLRIVHIDDGMILEPNTLYLNRPNMITQLVGDTFRARAYDREEALPHLPIDALFRSLADRDMTRTVVVILSGSGADGTRGAELLHEAGAAVMVQSPSEAAFPSMPRSVLIAGAVDRVLNANAMPTEIGEIFEHGKKGAGRPGAYKEDPSIAILRLLERHHYVDFSGYKPVNVQRRIERRKNLRGIRSADDYLELLVSDPLALDELYQDLLIGVTEFYRDPEAMAELREKALDRLVETTPEDAPLRIWVPACASGEEAYTIAIELSEALRKAGVTRKFRVIATDVHRRSIERASTGVYSEESLAKLPPGIRDRYFMRQEDQFMIEPGLRQKIIFSVHDALSDPPFMHLDLISCRNLLIYLNEASQARIISMFLFGLRQDGYLLLGPSESLGKFSQEFRSLNSRWRLYTKSSDRKIVDTSVLEHKMVRSNRFPVAPLEERPPVMAAPNVLGDIAELRNRETLIKSYDALLKRFAPSSILVAADGTVLGWFGSASLFIDTMNNLADWTVEEIVHPGLHFAINVGMEKLRQGQLEPYMRRVKLDMGGGAARGCLLHIEPLDQVSRNRFMLVCVELEDEAPPGEIDVPDMPQVIDGEDVSLLARRVHDLERDLRLTEETLKHVTERLEASGEQLQASNEELQASNEELQASNEELQSSNEELHAVNEELVSVSTEYERKIDLLSELNISTEAVYRMLDVGVIVVDSKKHIRRFSELVGDRFELETHDVDRSLLIVGPRLDFVDLEEFVTAVLATGGPLTAEGMHQGAPMSLTAHAIEAEEAERGPSGAILIFKGVSRRQDE